MNNKIENIQVLGSGCPTCKKLFELTQEAVSQLNLKVEVEYITDIQKIIELGIMSSPVLMINGKPALVGQLPGLGKVKEIISSCGQQDSCQSTGCCSCGGHC
ncbi:MAG: thioredoxin family protein [Patescibacteria group bacterium]|jgi:small redox-active disulfide protein 2